MYIPGLKKIETIDKDKVNFPYLFDSGLAIKTSNYFSDVFTDLAIIKNSASLNQKSNRSNGNTLMSVSVNFEMLISNENLSVLNQLYKKPAVYRVTDFDDNIYIVGTQRHRTKLSFEIINESSVTGKKVISAELSHVSKHGMVKIDESENYTGGGGGLIS